MAAIRGVNEVIDKIHHALRHSASTAMALLNIFVILRNKHSLVLIPVGLINRVFELFSFDILHFGNSLVIIDLVVAVVALPITEVMNVVNIIFLLS